MIAYLKGILTQKSSPRVIIEITGIGYEIMVPLSTYENLPDTGTEVKILTYVYSHEEGETIYGFMTPEEKQLFELLIAVTGVGPRVAINVLSRFKVPEFVQAILQKNWPLLTSVGRIGRKTAERLVVELGEKIKEWKLVAMPELDHQPAVEDAIGGLISLGYTQSRAREAVSKVLESLGDAKKSEIKVEELIRQALKFCATS